MVVLKAPHPEDITIGLIGVLYEAHRASKDEDGKVDAVRRKELSLPILAALGSLAARERMHIAAESQLAKALNYLDNQRSGLRRFLDDGYPSGQLRRDVFAAAATAPA